ncbi:MAG: hypothetical protein AB7O98_10085 [Hyphomonadaceae bacterium]
MRAALALAAVTMSLAACVVREPISMTTATLAAADAATSLIVGETVTLAYLTPGVAPAGQDPVVTLELRHTDGRALSFQQGNHTADDLLAQQPGGALAQIMGLFGEEAPLLYHAARADTSGAPFICGPEGPAALGVYDAGDGAVQIVGLKQTIQFETRPDGVREAVPFSPDQVCARLRFRRS